MFLDDAIPPARAQRDRVPNGENDIPYTSPGPYLAYITRFTGPFWEVDDGAIDAGTSRTARGTVTQETPGAIPRIRVHVVFDQLVGRTGDRLILSTKYRASRDAKSVFARLVAALGGIRPEAAATTNLDLLDFVDRAVSVTLRPGLSNTARIDSIMPAPVEMAVRASSRPAEA